MDRNDRSDELTVRAEARVGQRLHDKWRLDELLGVGGMAAVYGATHRNGKRVAIKVLHAEVATSVEVRRRFLREGYVANQVEHRGAVSVLDDDTTEDGAAFLVMDLFEGETLDARLRRKGTSLPSEEVLATAYHLLDVLAAAHSKGIIHRDIKPENVFLTREAEVKVLDFGIAHLRELSVGANATQAGHTMGTPSFMPPEQARGRWDDVDAQSDVWAVGATMFTLLAGRHVHEAETTNEVLLAAMTTKAPSLSLFRPELSRSVTDVVDRALAFDKVDRWPTAKAMQEALREANRAMKDDFDVVSRAPTLIATSVNPRAASTTARPTTRTAPEAHGPDTVRTQSSKRSNGARLAVIAVAMGAMGAAAAFALAPGQAPRAAASMMATANAVSTTNPPTTPAPTAAPAAPAIAVPPATVATAIPTGTAALAIPAPPAPRPARATTTPTSTPPATTTATPAQPPPANRNPLDRRH